MRYHNKRLRQALTYALPLAAGCASKQMRTDKNTKFLGRGLYAQDANAEADLVKAAVAKYRKSKGKPASGYETISCLDPETPGGLPQMVREAAKEADADGDSFVTQKEAEAYKKKIARMETAMPAEKEQTLEPVRAVEKVISVDGGAIDYLHKTAYCLKVLETGEGADVVRDNSRLEKEVSKGFSGIGETYFSQAVELIDHTDNPNVVTKEEAKTLYEKARSEVLSQYPAKRHTEHVALEPVTPAEITSSTLEEKAQEPQVAVDAKNPVYNQTGKSGNDLHGLGALLPAAILLYAWHKNRK